MRDVVTNAAYRHAIRLKSELDESHQYYRFWIAGIPPAITEAIGQHPDRSLVF
jgi:hypothetical protein